jgi:hypothetical protein
MKYIYLSGDPDFEFPGFDPPRRYRSIVSWQIGEIFLTIVFIKLEIAMLLLLSVGGVNWF